MSAADLSREATSIRYAIQGLRKQLDALTSSDFPGGLSGPRKWLKIIAGVLDTAEERLDLIEHGKSTDAVGDLREASEATESAYEKFVDLDGAGLSDLPYSVVIPLQRILDALQLKNDVFFRAKQEANYELALFEDIDLAGMRHKSMSLDDAMSKITWPFTRITVPSNAFSIIPHFAIVGHEIGHAVFESVDRTPIPDISKDTALISRISARLTALPAAIVGRFSNPIIEIYTEHIFENWVEELMADAIGLYLMGPAFFFALSEFLQLSAKSYGLGQVHPASDLRLELMHDELQNGGSNSFGKIFEAAMGRKLTRDFNSGALVDTPGRDVVFNDMARIIRDGAPYVQAAVIAEMYTGLKLCGPAIYAAAKAYLDTTAPTIVYSPQQFRHDIGLHLEPLLYAIPPIEIDDWTGGKWPTEFASILNVGWLVLLCKLHELKIGDANMSQRRRVEVLQGLILKALELSEARRMWEETRASN